MGTISRCSTTEQRTALVIGSSDIFAFILGGSAPSALPAFFVLDERADPACSECARYTLYYIVFYSQR